MAPRVHSHLVHGGLLARNVLWNLFGTGAPILVAIPVVPVLIRSIGAERFGVLTLAWAILGYASLFDLGLGRALTQVVAKKLGAGAENEVPRIVWTTLLLMLLLSCAGMVIVLALSPWMVHKVLKIPSGLQRETVYAFYLLGLSIPVVITGSGLRGLLEAHQRFDLVSAVRIPSGVFTYLGPLLALPFTHSLPAVIGVLVLGRMMTWAAHLWLCVRVVPELRTQASWHGPSARPLLRFGGWMSVSNVVGPLMATLDRFVIAGLVSLTAVTYYATPYEVVTKALLIPTAVVGVMFPAFSISFASDQGRATMLYSRTVKYVFLSLFPIVLALVALAGDGLRIWLGSDFAQHSTHVVQWLAVGVLANSLALVPVSFIQGVGRPDLAAKLHLIELPAYLLGLYLLIRIDGIDGAAIAWALRAALDCVALFFVARHLLAVRSRVSRKTKLLVASATLTLVLAAAQVGFAVRTAFLLGAILTFAVVTWFFLLTPEERALAARVTVMSR